MDIGDKVIVRGTTKEGIVVKVRKGRDSVFTSEGAILFVTVKFADYEIEYEVNELKKIN